MMGTDLGRPRQRHGGATLLMCIQGLQHGSPAVEVRTLAIGLDHEVLLFHADILTWRIGTLIGCWD